VTGLPRAGSTLVCQMLAQHPEIHCEGVSSPLCNVVLGVRRMIGKDRFFLSQLDRSFDTSYSHLAGAMQGFVRGWYRDRGRTVVADKNRAWLHAVELLLEIEPILLSQARPHADGTSNLNRGRRGEGVPDYRESRGCRRPNLERPAPARLRQVGGWPTLGS
jgi:hypothetical protein